MVCNINKVLTFLQTTVPSPAPPRATIFTISPIVLLPVVVDLKFLDLPALLWEFPKNKVPVRCSLCKHTSW